MIDKFRESFRDEASELLNSLEHSLLELEADPTNMDEISSVFRSMHTIKGSAAMFGFEEISRFAHEVETVLEKLRDGTIAADKRLIDLTLSARDHIRAMLESDDSTVDAIEKESDQLVAGFRALLPAEATSAPEALTEAPAGVDTSAIGIEEGAGGSAGDSGPLAGPGGTDDLPHELTYRIRFKPDPEIYTSGTNPIMLLQELAGLGHATIIPDLEGVPRLSQLDPEHCLVSWDVILTTRKPEAVLRDVFMFVEDRAELSFAVIDELESFEGSGYKRIGQILSERGAVTRSKLDEAAGKQRRLGEMLVAEGVPAHEVQAALQEQEHVRRTRERAGVELSASSVRVSSEKLDGLVDLVGELVTLQARLSRTAAELGDASVTGIAENFERLSAELRDSTMSVRMLPIGTTFSKFRRLVRDLSGELGKEIELQTTGGETELDKTVIERLNDPLVHIIRNCIDHGIETPEARVAAGKPQTGVVKVKAAHSGGSVVIDVEDDGKGINREAVLRRAVERGVIDENASLSDGEVQNLLFAPGFSTAAAVTQVSGRGVGMDVVKREIESLGGSVSIFSKEGEFTRMSLAIPLTLAIIEGLLVEIGEERYVFPLSAVRECLKFAEATEGEAGVIENRGTVLPFVDLRRLFASRGDVPAVRQLVVVASQNQSVGFVVDRVVGDHQTVIKNLGRVYRDVEGISGATILGDGSVALILDTAKLLRHAELEQSA
mgnify:CR=1 FL=1